MQLSDTDGRNLPRIYELLLFITLALNFSRLKTLNKKQH